ncbi:MAG: threonine--tRNA ligase [Candidatus Marsarchaeota archaeon]|jgi:threonyl-tRNA synthetase|nr:threonine--tRNA ligase [Candidatus Marsarchaeota archaeon]MCL5418475.1 threonine--tRNA ligase [Candidatus Marsarchaeota archaeon]
MKILQLDVNNITYELIKPEASIYEDSDEKRASIDDTLALLVSVEKKDTEGTAELAVKEAIDTMQKLKRERIVVYPFAHLSNDLAEPKEAMHIIDYMFNELKKHFDAKKAPFGWNKALSLSIKGHPLAEQSKSYGAEGAEAKHYAKAKPTSVNTAIVRKSDMSGLPEADHRTIGEKLDLFSFQEVSPGMVYWHKNGSTIFRQLVGLMRELLDYYDYSEISTPVLANIALWHVSGHIDHYKSNMFIFDSEGENMGMKPMNCPSTILVYKSRKWSYKELPFRTAIFDHLYRNEISGALTGLFRVREMTQDDGHIFAREDQIEKEVTLLLELVNKVYTTFGMKYKAKLSTMPEDHMGDEKLWEKASEALKKALDANKMEYEVKEKEGAFYGPKIDFDVFDSMGRTWQCATIQLDYQLPLRFGLTYTGEDGKEHAPVIIHRAILGSLERFIGVMIEHFQGKFPTWLAPVQARVITISEHENGYAGSVYKALRENGIRAVLDDSDRTLEYKIREAQMLKVPYMLVIGKKEADSNSITVRRRSGKQEHGVSLGAFIENVKSEIKERRLEQ